MTDEFDAASQRPTPPVFILTGVPGVGKSSVARALLSRFDKGLLVPVDDLRDWVVAGHAFPSPWTDETSRQFALAEQSAADLAVRYAAAGFAVAIDHCQSLHILDRLVETRLQACQVYRVGLHASLETALARNADRDKPFDTSTLVGVIEYLHPIFEAEFAAAPDAWTVLQTDSESLDATTGRILSLVCPDD